VNKEELRANCASDPELAAWLGVHLAREGRGAEDDFFEVFWDTHYHG
jgi:hypothetical protein